MSFLNDIAPKLRPSSPQDLLQRLAAHFQNKAWDDSSPRPLLTLHTLDGVGFTGVLLAVDEDRHQGRTVLFKIESQHSPYQNELVYLMLDRVTSVIVHGAERFAPQLSGGAVARAPGHPAPTQLDLRRLLSQEQAKLRDAGGPDLVPQLDSLPGTDDVRSNVLELCRALVPAVIAVRRDEMGKKALEAVKQVRFKQMNGETLAFKKEGDTLWLAGDFTRELADDVTAWMGQALDSAL